MEESYSFIPTTYFYIQLNTHSFPLSVYHVPIFL